MATDARPLTLDVVTPRRQILSALPVNGVVLSAVQGEMEVKPAHRPLLTTLRPGRLVAEAMAGPPTTYFVSGGFVEVLPDRVVVLADGCEPIDGIDLKEARAELVKAEQNLEAHKLDPEADRAPFQNAVETAAQRIKVAEQRAS